MAWSVHFIGKPYAIKRALHSYGQSLSGPSRSEFNDARPVLEALVDLNTRNDADFSLNASGEGFDNNGANARGITVILMRSNAMHVQ